MKRAFGMLLLLGILACVAVSPARTVGERALSFDLPAVDSFHYQLQNLDVTEASASDFPVLVTDYSLDGSGDGKLTPTDLTNLKTGGRIVLAYLSIGEAETYRYYWDPTWNDDGANDPDAPAWLGSINKAFPDNIKVRYWDTDWQDIIFGDVNAYLDQIIAQGFDGVYLDIVDAYEFWGPDGNNERPTARQDMIDFVTALAAYARASDADFYVVPQNGAGLVSDVDYLNVISGIGAEDTFYNGNRRQNKFHTHEVLPLLATVRDAGKAVLAVDYPTKAKKWDDFFNKAEACGFAAYNSGRDLEEMTDHALHPPGSGPVVDLDAPADGAGVTEATPPTLEWTAAGAVRYELQFSGTPDLKKIARLPKKKKDFLTATEYTPTAKEWKKIVKLPRKGDGSTIFWWVLAYDGSGVRKSAQMRRLDLP